jgi:hypothetical protein
MSEATLIPIRYLGAKFMKRDHLYGSDVTWESEGDVQLVPAAAAIKLLQHPEFEDARDGKDPVPLKELASKEPEELLEEVDEALKMPLVDLNVMTKAQIIQYAHRYLGVELSPAAKKTELVDTVRRQTRGK